MSWKKAGAEAQLLLVGIPVLLWTLVPIYHMVLFAISERDSATSGRLWPKNPTLQNFNIVFERKHFYLDHFWQQMGNSLFIALAVGAITLVIATCAAFAISRLKVRGGRTVMNLALFTYFIPAAFLAVPMYKSMGNYGLLNSQWALILAMVTIASPYCIWVLKQASDKLPWELDEAARMDGAGWFRIYRQVVMPLSGPAIATVAILTFLPAWNSYLWPLMVVQTEELRPVMVGVQYFFQLNVSWGEVMAYSTLITLPVVALFIAFQRSFVNSIASSGVKG